MDPGAWLLPYLITNAATLALAGVCLRWKGAGRILFALLFLGAACVNAVTASQRPGDYLAFAYTARLGIYRDFILGGFSAHIPLFVGLIAAGQFAIAALLAAKGAAVRLGLAGAVFFFLAIAPLGIGSAFPSTLIASAAALSLWRAPFSRSLAPRRKARG